MQGRKPAAKNVVPFRSDDPSQSADLRRAAVDMVVRRLRPKGLDREMQREWTRVGAILADPVVDRLKPRFVDVIVEYCRLCIRLRAQNALFRTPDEELYEIAGRNGTQRKIDPRVAQRHETFREWNSLRMELGLGPASERGMLPGQGDLFDESEQFFTG